MSFATVIDATIGFVSDHIAFAQPIVFGLGFAEGIPGLSLLVPSSALFLGIGAAHSAAGGAFWQLWLMASCGAVVGDCVTYVLGRHFKDHISGLKSFQRHPDWLQRGHDLFEKWGVLAVVVGKFTGFLRPFIPAVAGIAKMPFLLFLAASIVSSLAWAGAFLAPGYGIKWLIG
jgi:membrane protein DedA with SNARE-associated domain